MWRGELGTASLLLAALAALHCCQAGTSATIFPSPSSGTQNERPFRSGSHGADSFWESSGKQVQGSRAQSLLTLEKAHHAPNTKKASLPPNWRSNRTDPSWLVLALQSLGSIFLDRSIFPAARGRSQPGKGRGGGPFSVALKSIRRLLRESQDEAAEADQSPPGTQAATVTVSLHRRRRPTFRVRPRTLRPPTACWACFEKRYFYPEGLLSSGSPGVPGFADRLETYMVMHRRCTAGITDWDAFYQEQPQGVREGHHVEGCKYLLYSTPDAKTGIPDRLLGALSVFVYALLTGRVFLISSQNLPLAKSFADPLRPTSRWDIPVGAFQRIREDVQARGPRNTGLDPNWDGKRLSLVLKASSPKSDWSFFCPEEQAATAHARFSVFSTALFFVPALYVVPYFKAELESLFPSRRVFLRVSQFLLNPSNALWDRIVRVYEGQMAQSHLLVGMELGDAPLPAPAQSSLLDSALRCAQGEVRCLPEALPPDEWRKLSRQADDVILRRSHGPSVSVFVSTSNVTSAEKLRALFTYGKPRDGSSVTVHSEADLLDWEEFETERTEQILSDLWVLSFSDVLLVTEKSVLGVTAAALGGVVPHVVPLPRQGEGGKAEPSADKCWPGLLEPCLRFLPPDGAIQCRGGGNATLSSETEILQQCPGQRAGIALVLNDDGYH